MVTYHKEYKSRVLLGEYRTPKMVVWMLKHSGGLLKTERQAAAVLFGFILFTLRVIQHPLIYAPAPELAPGRGINTNNIYRP